MYDFAVAWDWLSFAARWLHVMTAIAWIGSSFYFVALDLGLRQRPDLPQGVHGEEWQVHGGGFYHIQKYLVAPPHLPEHLIWFKWESYATWLSGFVLLCLVYYAGADLYLIDPAVLDVSAPVAIFISIASLVLGWFIYDLICKFGLGKNDTVIMVLLYGVLVAVSWGYTQLFTGRAAFLHLGAFTATIMAANVFMLIIPNQKIVVADLIAGKTPDPKYGKLAKQRSTHNNYLTLPVVFLMLSNHYPLAFATEYNWIIASLVFLMGVTIRHWFNTRHAGKGKPTWTWIVTLLLFIAIIWLSSIQKPLPDESQALPMTPAQQNFVVAENFPQVRDTILGRCSMCHAKEPAWDGIITAPKGVILETDREIASHAREIYLQAGRSHAMPPANITAVSDEERRMLAAWYETSVKGGKTQ
ncbi:putative membrane protein [Paenochrobactrum gallinarii]|uniref:Putative membrane protein n=1 Tax=Paenochrobactrum gallinarii TaxID=643673 RepID=A0A841LVS9_9HYPH|nr:urate hydroxylase PuuD [Paenochrobactrum gallinarii]MBB6260587.1 putative membrane protein [Paenochrobactrum gallinarii]